MKKTMLNVCGILGVVLAVGLAQAEAGQGGGKNRGSGVGGASRTGAKPGAVNSITRGATKDLKGTGERKAGGDAIRTTCATQISAVKSAKEAVKTARKAFIKALKDGTTATSAVEKVTALETAMTDFATCAQSAAGSSTAAASDSTTTSTLTTE